MAKFVVIDQATGAIRRSGDCPPADVDIQAGAGEVSILVTEDIRDDTHYLSPEGFAPLPPKPSEFHEFDATTDQWVATAQNLGRAKALVMNRINLIIGEVRKSYSSDIPGQDLVYLRKEEEARRWLADASPNIAAYPFIGGEIGLTAATGNQLANLWLNMGRQWSTKTAALEKIRITARNAVQAATTPAEVQGARQSFLQDLAALQAG